MRRAVTFPCRCDAIPRPCGCREAKARRRIMLRCGKVEGGAAGDKANRFRRPDARQAEPSCAKRCRSVDAPRCPCSGITILPGVGGCNWWGMRRNATCTMPCAESAGICRSIALACIACASEAIRQVTLVPHGSRCAPGSGGLTRCLRPIRDWCTYGSETPIAAHPLSKVFGCGGFSPSAYCSMEARMPSDGIARCGRPPIVGIDSD